MEIPGAPVLKETDDTFIWYRAREVFFTLGHRSIGAKIAGTSLHPDAVTFTRWLSQACEHTIDWEKKLFAQDDKRPLRDRLWVNDDKRPLEMCFYGLVFCCWAFIERAAKLGIVFAQITLSRHTFTEFKVGDLTYSQFIADPAGAYGIGNWHYARKEKEEALKLWKRAAEMGHIDALYKLGRKSAGPLALFYFSLAAPFRFSCIQKLVCSAVKACKNDRLYIGWACKSPLLSWGGLPWLEISAVRECIAAYDDCCDVARLSISAWTGVAMRFGVVNDIRLLIAKLIWAERINLL